jgi:hypothetical protein
MQRLLHHFAPFFEVFLIQIGSVTLGRILKPGIEIK